MANVADNSITIYDGACIRNKGNWAVSSNTFKFDNPAFDPEELKAVMRNRSPKMAKLFSKIRELDAADMARDGHYYKHFIFSDIKNGLFGAKLLASAFIAEGYTMGYSAPHLGGERYGKIHVKDAETLAKTASNNLYLMSSVAVYGAPIPVEVKRTLFRRFNARPQNVHGEEVRFIIMDSGFKEGIDLFDVKYVHIFEPPVSDADKKQIVGRATRTCGQKGLLFHPTAGWPLHVFTYDLTIPPAYREMFYDSRNAMELYLKAIGIDFRLLTFADDLERLTILGSVDYELNRKIHEFSVSGAATRSNQSIRGGNVRLPRCPRGFHRSKKTGQCRRKNCPQGTRRHPKTGQCVEYVARPRRPRTAPAPAPADTEPFADLISLSPLSATPVPPFVPVLPSVSPLSATPPQTPIFTDMFSTYHSDGTLMTHSELRDFIRRHYAKYAWSDVKMENLCETKATKNGGKKTELIKFTPTQDFVRNYFTPTNPVRGMLLWHSVGTGKTCSAIAAASSAFEPLGYTILWVTRTTLKNDIWKNMFEQVCLETFRQDKREDLPDTYEDRMRLLSKSWGIRPMSYKQFSNMVSKKNDFYDALVKRNGKVDPLQRTLLIIDEAHKLYGETDLSAIERPDMDALHRAVMNSYVISGANSVKLLLMTATPITKNPMELIQLLNLCKLPEQQMPSTFDSFAEEYLSPDSGKFTAEGSRRYLNDIAGLVSYLNREKDARQFAQPRLANVCVPLVSAALEKTIQRYDKRMVTEQKMADLRPIFKEQVAYKRQLEEEWNDIRPEKYAFLKNSLCVDKHLEKETADECSRVIKGRVDKILAHLKDRRADIKEKLDELKAQQKRIEEHYRVRLEEMNEDGGDWEFEDDDINGHRVVKGFKERVKEYQQTPFYQFKYDCGSRPRTETEWLKFAKTHPDFVSLNERIEALEEEAKAAEAQLRLELDARQKRIVAMKEAYRDGTAGADLNKEIMKAKRDNTEFAKRERKEVAARVKTMKHEREQAIEKRKKTVKNLRDVYKQHKKDEADRIKQNKEAVQELQKEARDDSHIQDEFLRKQIAEERDVLLDELASLYERDAQLKTEKEVKKIQNQYANVQKEFKQGVKAKQAEERKIRTVKMRHRKTMRELLKKTQKAVRKVL